VTIIRFTKEVCATLGIKYDVLKGRDDAYILKYLDHQERFILNFEHIQLLGSSFSDKKQKDYFYPSQSRINSSLVDTNIDKELYEEIAEKL